MAQSIPGRRGAARISDKEAILGAVMNARSAGGAQVADVDAVAGASLGVEGIIEAGRKALLAKRNMNT